MLELYVFGNGDLATAVLRAIALFCNSQNFDSMVRMGLACGLFATGMHYFWRQEPGVIKRWFGMYLLLPVLLWHNQTSVQIIDVTNPLGNHRVAQVPVVLAFPAALLSSYMYEVTRAVDKVFHTVDDQMYSRTGMLFGSKLFHISRQPQLQNRVLQDDLTAYLRNCVAGDIRINQKYTWAEWMAAPDIWAFWEQQRQSPIRRTEVDGTNLSCRQALPELKRQFKTDVRLQLDHLNAYADLFQGQRLTGHLSLQRSLQQSYQTYLGISRSAAGILQQNMTINAIQRGLHDHAIQVNATAAALNYAEVQNAMQATSMWAGMALQAAYFLPLMHQILFLLFACSVILVFPLAMIPQLSWVILSNYVRGFLHLGLWPILFAFLNFIMTTRLSLSSAGVADLYHGLTLSNADQLSALHSKYAAMTGFLMMSVPFITHFIVQGGAAVMGSVSQQFASTLGGMANRTSAAMATGDIAHGNVQIGNYSYHNENANKIDTSGLEVRYGHSVRDKQGNQITAYKNGARVYNTAQAISQVGLDLNSQASQIAGLSQTYQDSQQSTRRSVSSWQASVQQAADQMYNFTHQSHDSQSSGQGTSQREVNALSDAQSTMRSVVNEYANLHNISHADANNNLYNFYQQGQVQTTKDIFLGIPWLIGLYFDVSGSVGVRKSQDRNISDSDSQSTQTRNSQSLQQQYNLAASYVQEFAHTAHTEQQHGSSDQQVNSLARSLREVEDRSEQMQVDWGRTQAIQQTLNQAQQQTLGLNENLMPAFQDYAQRRLDAEGLPLGLDAVMLGTDPSLRSLRLAWAGDFLTERFAEYMTTTAMTSGMPDLQAEYQRQASEVQGSAAQRQRLQPLKTAATTAINQSRLVPEDKTPPPLPPQPPANLAADFQAAVAARRDQDQKTYHLALPLQPVAQRAEQHGSDQGRQRVAVAEGKGSSLPQTVVNDKMKSWLESSEDQPNPDSESEARRP
jgi:conjugal transfer mating pair stabilization protein TraG